MTRAGPGAARAGLVLAGGYSTRFGEADKAFAELGGRPLIRHVLARLDHVTDGLLVSCRDEQLPLLRQALTGTGLSAGAVPDPVPDRGPAAGIAAGLAPCRPTYAAVVACDTPLVDPGFLSALFERAEGCDGAVPRVDGRLRPTLAVYRTAAIRDACKRSIASGDGSLRRAVERVDVVVVPEDQVARETELRRLRDVNTPGDLAGVRETFGRDDEPDPGS
ncbi:MAG: molybdenum cofactor guanylyltransferase [Halobacteriales archaeon]